MTRRLIIPIAGLAGAALALLAGIALAKSYTLTIAKDAKVTDQSSMTTKAESIVIASSGFAVYTLSGDSMRHPECTSSQCRHFWPPLRVHGKAHLSDQPGIHGKLGTWRHDGFTQLTLGGHPLYMFSLDKHKHAATGEGVVSFGGTWRVVRPSGPSSSHSTQTTTTATMTTASTTSYTSSSTTTYSSTTSTYTTSSACVGYYC